MISNISKASNRSISLLAALSITIAFYLTMAVSCASDPAKSNPTQTIAGRYKSGMTIVDLKDNRTYQVFFLKNSEDPADFQALQDGKIDHLPQKEKLIETSTYTINGNTILLQGHWLDFKRFDIKGTDLSAYSPEKNDVVYFSKQQ